ncbi:hypothetical protein BASA81_002928 [Batrachochytrium salamandrivorans]|nr:hypothetical protein BASA81_002928 [Batrachochytrium salamandrivorans]
MSSETNSSWLSGPVYDLPEGSEFIIVRVPAHVDAAELNNLKISDLKQDPAEITSQLTFLSTVDDGKQFAQFTAARSYSYVAAQSKKQLEDMGQEVAKTEKRVLVPPKGLGVSRIPFAGPPLKKRSAAKEPASLSATSTTSSESKKKRQRKSSE